MGKAKSSKKRSDGRGPHELRPMQVEQGVINRADGSCHWVCGGTSVLAAVTGPALGRTSRREQPDRGAIDVVVKLSTRAAAGRVALERTLEAALRRTAEAVVLLERYPRLIIALSVLVEGDDGGAVAVALNAAALALIDARIAMRAVPLSVCIALRPADGDGGGGGGAGQPLRRFLDPTAEEEEGACATATATIDSASGNTLALDASGLMGDADVLSCVDAAGKASAALMEFVRQAAVPEVGTAPP